MVFNSRAGFLVESIERIIFVSYSLPATVICFMICMGGDSIRTVVDSLATGSVIRLIDGRIKIYQLSVFVETLRY